MHRGAFFMRGGSIVGAVLLIALLSAAAVMIDSGKLAQRESMLAGATTPTSKTSTSKAATTPEKETSTEYKAVTSTCEVGYDYIIAENSQGTPEVFYASYTGQRYSTTTKSAANRCWGSNTDARDGSGRKCTTELWECKYSYCRFQKAQTEEIVKDSSGGAQKACITISKKAKVGHQIDAAKEAKNDAAKQVTDLSLTPEERKQAEDFIKTGNYTESNELLKAWTQQERDAKLGVELQEGLVQKAKEDQQAKLKAFLDNRTACASPSPSVVQWSSSCEKIRQELSDADKKLAEERKRLEDLRKQAQRLGELKTMIQPQATQPKVDALERISFCDADCQKVLAGNGTTFEKPPRGGQEQCQGIMCELRKYLGPDNGNSDGYRCQYLNDYSACMRVSGAPYGVGPPGAYGAYGAYPSAGGNDPYCITSYEPLIVQPRPAGPGCLNYRPQSASQQCGTQQQQGGLIGTIVSLFTKKNNSQNNGGCVNGVPVPSCTITASPQNISAGQPVTLTWQSQQAFNVTLSSSGSVAPQGSTTVNPQTTTTYTLQLGGYMDNRSGQQLRGQCAVQVVVGNQGGTDGTGAPRAEISCRPEVADVGMSVALSFACRNSSTSGGTGFDTNNQLSGSATPIVESPSLGTSVVKYGLTCSKEGKTDTAECTVKINKASIVLIANPKDVKSGGEANIGWVTGGMEECTISSPTLSGFTAENAGNTSTSGVAKTPPLTQDTKFVLSCITKSGGTKTAETTVKVGN